MVQPQRIGRIELQRREATAEPDRVTFLNASHLASDRVANLTYGQLGHEIDRLVFEGRNDAYAAGREVGYDEGLKRGKAKMQAAKMAPHIETQNKLSSQASKLTTGMVVATLGLASAAISQVPTIVALSTCEDKAEGIANLTARAATLHDCRVSGHIAIAVTAVASASAIVTGIAAGFALYRYCTTSTRTKDDKNDGDGDV